MGKKKTEKKYKNKGRSVRRKGHQFEREVAILLRPIFPNARRHLEYQDGEANGVDIAHTGVFKFQCKKLKKYASINKINEIKPDAKFHIPVLVTAGDNLKPMAVLEFNYFLEMIKIYERYLIQKKRENPWD